MGGNPALPDVKILATPHSERKSGFAWMPSAGLGKIQLMAPVLRHMLECERCGARRAKLRPVRHPDYRGANLALTICDKCADAIDIRDADAWRWLRVRAVEEGKNPA